jgi:PhoPQ-activated pathogenicity-related protein
MLRALTLAALLTAAGPLTAQPANEPATALASYVAKPDDSYTWEVRARFERNGAEIVELRLHSQTWRDILWKHRLFIIKPASLDESVSQGMLMIGGGRWQDELETAVLESLPDGADEFIQIAEILGSVMAVVSHVPFQPLYGGLTEDRLIAHTFEKYLAEGDPEWPLLLPMVKSAVRAMDATQAFVERDWDVGLEAFTVMGGSKRGWTTWLTAAVDERVSAFAPMVIDVLNFADHVPHQTAKWGRPSDSISPYTELGLEEVLASDEGEALRTIVDPYSYLDALPQPKLIVIGTNDPYFPLDSLNLYWNEVREPKYALYLPNNTHSLRDFGRLLPTLRQLHRHAAAGEPMARLDWEYHDRDGPLTLCMETDTVPRSVRVWVAESDDLDFRDASWTPRRVERTDGGWRFVLEGAPSGYLALFGEAAFGAGSPYYLSTAVKIVGPDVPGRPPHSDSGVCRSD